MGLIASEAVPQQATKSNTQINSFKVLHIISPKALAACTGTVSLKVLFFLGCVCVFFNPIHICAHVHTCTLTAPRLCSSSSGLSLERL